MNPEYRIYRGPTYNNIQDYKSYLYELLLGEWKFTYDEKETVYQLIFYNYD